MNFNVYIRKNNIVLIKYIILQHRYLKYLSTYVNLNQVPIYLPLLTGVDAKGRGLLYSSYMECLTKTFKREGIHGLYKGVIPCYLRLGPHVVLSMVFWDALRQFQTKVSAHLNNSQHV